LCASFHEASFLSSPLPFLPLQIATILGAPFGRLLTNFQLPSFSPPPHVSILIEGFSNSAQAPSQSSLSTPQRYPTIPPPISRMFCRTSFSLYLLSLYASADCSPDPTHLPPALTSLRELIDACVSLCAAVLRPNNGFPRPFWGEKASGSFSKFLRVSPSSLSPPQPIFFRFPYSVSLHLTIPRHTPFLPPGFLFFPTPVTIIRSSCP